MMGTEQLVWAAVFAGHWIARREAQRKYGGDAGDAEIAATARDEATCAVHALREVINEQTLEAEAV
jgi:hypothetical protein